MKTPHAVIISGDITHVCGEYLSYYLGVVSDKSFPTELRVVEERFTLTAYFNSPLLHFKVHGSRVKRCPGCGLPLPTTIEAVNDAEFRGEE